jgi:hypothetical protein
MYLVKKVLSYEILIFVIGYKRPIIQESIQVVHFFGHSHF